MFTDLNFNRATVSSQMTRFLFCVLCLASIASAQDADTKNATSTDEASSTSKTASDDPLVFGSVENKDHQPVANAKVWLVRKYPTPLKVLGETTTDDQGQFAFSNTADGVNAVERFQLLSVWAEHPSQGLGWLPSLGQFKRKSLTVQLSQTATFSGQLIGPAGQSMAGVKITPTYLGKGEGGNMLQPPPNLTQRLSTTTADDGKFAIKNLPATGFIMLDVAAEGFDKLHLNGSLDKPMVINLNAGVTFSGRVTWPKEVEIPADQDFEFGTVTLMGYSKFRADGSFASDRKQGVCATQITRSIKIDREGRFRLDDLTPGQYNVFAKLSPSLPLIVATAEPFEVKPKEAVNDFELVAEKALQISGRVVSFENQAGIANAVVRHSTVVDGRTSQHGRTTTDKDGKYSVYVKKGKCRFSVADAPKEFIPSASSYDSEFSKSRIPMIDVTKDMTWPDLILDSACDVTIEVFDENGKPAADAVVKIVAMAGYPAGEDYSTSQRTDANGRYVIRRVTVNDTLPIRVRTPTAISEIDLVITPSELDGPLRIDLSPDHGFRCRCRAVDRDGEPIANADVSVGTSYPYVSKWSNAERGYSLGGSAGGGVTNSDGTFESGPLWPDRAYSLTVKAEGYAQSETPQVSGKVGKVVELKSIVLSTAKASKVVGVVVDSAKQPVEDVRVFAAGKNYRLAKTRTNAAGQFQLDEVAGDIRYVFADGGADYRFGGARLRNQQPLEITIRSVDSPAKGIRKNRKLPRDEQLEVANALIERAWNLPGNIRNNSSSEMLLAMVQIDPERAIEKALASRRGSVNYVRAEQAIRTVDEDPDSALQLLQPVRNRTGISTAIALGMKLAKSNNEKDKKAANEFAEFALQLIDGNKKYHPELATLFTALGQQEKARELIDATLELIDLDNLTDKQTYTTNRLALAIAPYDFEKAQSLASLAEKGYQRTAALADVAMAVVTTDYEKTIREIDELTGDSNAPNIRDKARYRAACLLLDDHPDVAIKLVHQCEEDDNRSQALGRLAVRVAEFDQPQAWKMIDAALTVHRDHPSAFDSWSNYGGGGVFAAALTCQAQQVDYPDMESVIWQVRAACRATSDQGQERLSATVKTARMLALVDKIAARDLLNAVAHKTDQFSSDRNFYNQWLQAWLMVDFGRGVKLLNDELDELQNSDAKEKQTYSHRGMFRFLVAPSEERYKSLLYETGLWKLEEDGTADN